MPTFDAASLVAFAALDAVDLAAVVVAFALLRGVEDCFLAVVDAFLAVDLVALLVCVFVVFALEDVVFADRLVALVASWRRIRDTRVSPRLTRSPKASVAVSAFSLTRVVASLRSPATRASAAARRAFAYLLSASTRALTCLRSACGE